MYFFIKFYINTAAISVAINLNILYGYKTCSHKFFAVDGCVKARGQAELAPAQKFAQRTHHPLGVHAKRLMESEHTPVDAHTWRQGYGRGYRPTQPPTHYNRHSTRSNWKAEKLQLSRDLLSQSLQVPMHLSYISDQLSDTVGPWSTNPWIAWSLQ